MRWEFRGLPLPALVAVVRDGWGAILVCPLATRGQDSLWRLFAACAGDRASHGGDDTSKWVVQIGGAHLGEKCAEAGMDWMVRMTLADKPTGDPGARDLVLKKDGSAFFDSLQGAGGEPVAVTLAGRGKQAPGEATSLRLGAAAKAVKAAATVLLANGTRLRGDLLAVTATSVKVRVSSGGEREVPRAEVVRIDLQ